MFFSEELLLVYVLVVGLLWLHLELGDLLLVELLKLLRLPWIHTISNLINDMRPIILPTI